MLPLVRWTVASAVIVLFYHGVVGWLAGRYLELQSWSGLNRTLVEAALLGSGWLAAGLVVGAAGRRLLEPALGALLACLGLWLTGRGGTPWLAFPVTLAGAWLGERWSRP